MLCDCWPWPNDPTGPADHYWRKHYYYCVVLLTVAYCVMICDDMPDDISNDPFSGIQPNWRIPVVMMMIFGNRWWYDNIPFPWYDNMTCYSSIVLWPFVNQVMMICSGNDDDEVLPIYDDDDDETVMMIFPVMTWQHYSGKAYIQYSEVVMMM